MTATHQVRGIGSSDAAMGLDKGWFQLGHLFKCGYPDAIVLLHSLVHSWHLEGNHIREATSLLGFMCQSVGAQCKLILLLPRHL